MIEKKLISFTVLKNNYAYLLVGMVTNTNYCSSRWNKSNECNKQNCPIWKKLDEERVIYRTQYLPLGDVK